MKKIVTVLSLILTIYGFGQEVEKPVTTKKSIYDRKHEVKIGAAKLLASIFEGTYEYIDSKDFTYGASLLVNLDKKNNYYEDFSITPFARFYFQESKEYGAKGFFVEGFGKYTSGKNINFFSNNEKFSAASFGFSLGKKWINSSGFVFEPLLGLSRTIGGAEHTPDLIPRFDLFIGYRF